jgi:hypothetical protein
MSTPRRAGEILNHYLKLLFESQGLTWSRENQADIIDLVRGLATPASRPTVPPAPPAAPRPAARAAAPRSYDTVEFPLPQRRSAGDEATWLNEAE